MLGIAYPEVPFVPFFGTPTSRHNFCEEDHIVTSFIGEFINTLSNIAYIYYAARGLQRLRHVPHSRHASLQYYGLATVGIASAIFHCLLKYHSQMGDDLSMLFAAGAVFHRIWTFDKSERTQTWAAVAVFGFLILFSTWHMITNEIHGHALLFGIMVVVVAYKTVRVLNERAKPVEKRQLGKLALIGSLSFASGYGFWNLDFLACDTLNETRHTVGMPLAFILELHGWWHILTAVGVYVCMALVEYLTEPDAGSHGFAWPASSFIGNAAAGAAERGPVTMDSKLPINSESFRSAKMRE
ncbi:unnamed protein product [Cercospora beticola]|nr:unnamed protein product [Cercospora beticola]